MINPKLTKHLEANKVKYQIVPHKKVYTALDAAATLKVKLEEIAKSLVVKADKTYYLVILAANKNANLKKLQQALKAKKLEMPKEAELVKVFKVKPGNLTGFGSIHQMPTIVDKGYQKVKQAIFSGGSLMESVKIKVADYLKLEQAIIHQFSEIKKINKVKKSAKPKAKKTKPTKKKKASKKIARKK
ncbi:MAG: YbaK/EbsC family protein [Candidatus Komeilibacteria bacterium]|nr:YbaK/EbsC family protein [Candidatus Komeilibacteria bacterium]